ncbi:MAG: hypothetical protein Q4D88_01160 [Anaerococcus sp.]|nr:hypothetical protein [Anaerococcus sp.]
MKKSLLRIDEKLILFFSYLLCFALNIFLDYLKSKPMDSLLLEIFLSQFLDYKVYIVGVFTIIVLLFHLKVLDKKEKEIYCRFLVGDYLKALGLRYGVESFFILLISLFLAELVAGFLSLSLITNIYLALFLLIYTLVSWWKVRNYENF